MVSLYPLTGIAELGGKFMAKFRQNNKIRISEQYFRRVVKISK